MTVKNKTIEDLVAHVLKLGYGETIPHSEIEGILGEPHSSSKYFDLVRRANKNLLSHQKMMQNLRGVGYQIIEPDEYVGVAVHHYSKAFRRLKRGNDVLVNAPVACMSREGMDAHRAVSDRARSLFASMSGGCVELKLLARKPSPLAVENVGRP